MVVAPPNDDGRAATALPNGRLTVSEFSGRTRANARVRSAARMRWTPPATIVGIEVPRVAGRHRGAKEGGVRMNRTTIAVDLAKNVFQVAVADADWRVVSRHRLSRGQLLRFFGERQPCLVVVEACGTAHFWGRWLNSLGFTVRLLPPQYVRAFVRRNKTDRGDAEALLEAARSAELAAGPVKSEQQHALLSLHR